jgi:hypothetical protein
MIMKTKKIIAVIISGLLTLSVAGCTTTETDNDEGAITQENTGTTNEVNDEVSSNIVSNDTEDVTIVASIEGSILETSDMFSDRDLVQSVDLSEATSLSLESDTELVIEEEGIYIISGQVTETTIIVDADDEAKVQLILDGVSIINEDAPAIYVKSGDKVFVTTTDSENYLEVSGNYEADGDTNLDAVIYSKPDLVVNGVGTLEVISATGNGITSKDDLKITGGTLEITADEDGLEANDSIRIYDGDITITSNKDGLHSENDEDSSLGYIYIQNGTFNIAAADDAIHGTSVIQIDGGDINIETCQEGIEATYIQINGGTITIYATDDGINATSKSSAYDVVIEVNDGNITVSMASGDTDAFDANGDIIINGGTINIEAVSSFDADGTAVLNGGEVTVNGVVITEITQEQMGGGQKHR